MLLCVESFKRCFNFLHVLIAKRCSPLLIYQNAAKRNFEISLVTGHQYYFLCKWFIGKGEPGTWKQPRCHTGRGLTLRTVGEWQHHTDGQVPQLNKASLSPVLLTPYWRGISCYLCLLIWEFCQCPERRVLQRRCVSLPEPAPITSRTLLRLGRNLCPVPPISGCDLQAPGTLNFKFFNWFKGSVTASK